MSTGDVSAVLRANSLNGNAQAFAAAPFRGTRSQPGFWHRSRTWIESDSGARAGRRHSRASAGKGCGA